MEQLVKIIHLRFVDIIILIYQHHYNNGYNHYWRARYRKFSYKSLDWVPESRSQNTETATQVYRPVIDSGRLIKRSPRSPQEVAIVPSVVSSVTIPSRVYRFASVTSPSSSEHHRRRRYSPTKPEIVRAFAINRTSYPN